MSRLIDRAIQWLKWPSAVLSAALLPRALWALWATVPGWLVPGNWFWLAFFGGGVALYFALWRAVRGAGGSVLFTLEHELTHAIFAWATGHRVTNLRATWSKGGSVTYVGQPNWLIALAPYFFPTIFLPLVLLGLLTPWIMSPVLHALLGAAMGFHLHSSVRELHAEQRDLREVGWLFSALFLPTANLLALGSVLGFSAAGTVGLTEFWRAVVAGTNH